MTKVVGAFLLVRISPRPRVTVMPTDQQVAQTVLMVRPAAFDSNPQTAFSNYFQISSEAAGHLHEAAQREFDSAVQVLRRGGVNVVQLQDAGPPHKPDALFPNNWLTTHADGTVVLYPMLAPNRRAERRPDLLELLRVSGFSVSRIEDLTHWEASDAFLEGTGSLVLDRVHRLAYACRSPRTSIEVLESFAVRLKYRCIAFDAVDQCDRPIYHTNVMLSVGCRFAAVCLECIASSQVDAVRNQLLSTGHEIIELSLDQVRAFAGNMLELATTRDNCVALSDSAANSLTSRQRGRLGRLAGRLLTADLRTIERYGGGSFRCMLAEIHLPRVH